MNAVENPIVFRNVLTVHMWSVYVFAPLLPQSVQIGIESVFFGKSGSKVSGCGDSGPYQKQSGMNNLALAITALLVE